MSKKDNFKRVLLCALFTIIALYNVLVYSHSIEYIKPYNISNIIDTINVDSLLKDTIITDSLLKDTVNIDSLSKDTLTDIQELQIKLMESIIYIESRGKLNAVNGSCCGPMQISPVMVKSCNKILKERGINKQFTLKDRFNLEKSKEMFIVYNSKYNPEFNIEKAIRSWNGGSHYKIQSTQGYYNKVMKHFKEHNN